MLKKYADFIKFNIVGLLNTAVDFAVFTLLLWLASRYRTGSGESSAVLLTVQCISYTAGIVNSFLLNKYWTFRNTAAIAEPDVTPGSRHSAFGQAVRFLVLNGVSLLISLVLLFLFKNELGLAALPAKVLVTVFTMLVNYAGSKLWVFRGGSRSTPSPD